MPKSAPKEWDAPAYHRLSSPQLRWGMKVLERLELRGDERIVDAGCGSGRLTSELLERAPYGHVVAVDRSSNMLAQAKTELEPRFAGRVTFIEADLASFVADPAADVVFSTATFHWIHDHDQLFASIARSLASRGRLVAQLGGPGNLARVHAHADKIFAERRFAERMGGFSEPTYFPSVEATRQRMLKAGLTRVKTWTEPAPAPFEESGVLREFLGAVILRAHLAHLDDAGLADELLDRMVDLLAKDDPPRTLDYIRLNADAHAPSRSNAPLAG